MGRILLLLGTFFAVLGLGTGCGDGGGGSEAAAETADSVLVRLAPDAAVIQWAWPPMAQSMELSRSRFDAAAGWIDEGVIGLFAVGENEYADTAAFEARYIYSLNFRDGAANDLETRSQLVSLPSYALDASDFEQPVDDPYMAAMGDVDGDGTLEVLGAWNDGAGGIWPEDSFAIGLDPLFADGRVPRDARLADLDGDGDLDVIANTYSSLDDPASRAMLFWNDGTGFFYRDLAFELMDIRGYGETILTFDYDNDGDLDIFLPYYTHESPLEQCYLLENDEGRFRDVAYDAGVAMPGIDVDLRVEGAMAADVNDDGWIDFYVASHLFLNRGNGTFIDKREEAGLPIRFDEGAFFTDWDLDGDLDLVIHHPNLGPALYELTGFSATTPRTPLFELVEDAFPTLPGTLRFGASAGDLNLDGYEDIQIAAGVDSAAVVLVNRHDYYDDATSPRLALSGFRTDSGAIADLDSDGIPDIVRRASANRLFLQRGTTMVDQMPVVEVVVTGIDGQRNQQGRVVRMTPVGEPGVVITRVVDGGSGYMSQRPYAMRIGSPYPGPHRVEVQFGAHSVAAIVDEGESVEIREDGTILLLAAAE